MTSDLALSLTGLTKKYSKKIALQALNLDVPIGTVALIVGPNGSGKSTTIKLVAGVSEGEGETRFFGHLRSNLVRPGEIFGVLFDSNPLFDHWTVIANLTRLSSGANVDKTRIMSLIETAGLRERAHCRVADLSLGMKRRVGLILTMVQRPRILLLDEPTNGLDGAGIDWLISLLSRYLIDGGTVLCSTHEVDAFSEIANSITILEEGRTVWQGDPESVPGVKENEILVRTDNAQQLAQLLIDFGVSCRVLNSTTNIVNGIAAPYLSKLIVGTGFNLHELRPIKPRLSEKITSLLESTTGAF